jgi:tryptophanyl-tRNA synthetase
MNKCILTGDRPTGKLHLGHLVGSLMERVKMQEDNNCYFIIADLHTLTTRPEKEKILQMRDTIAEVVLDYLSCGIDPDKSTIYLQSAIPALYQIHLFFEMLISLNRLTGLPSLKEMAKNAHIDPDRIPFGLIGYPVLQAADILMAKATHVPIGKDNLAHIECTRDIAKRFNQTYGELFPLPEPILTNTPSLIGTDGKSKMSKSANNAIFLTDDAKTVEKKVYSMFTDPNRTSADVPGKVIDNPVFIYHDLFNSDKTQVEELKVRYLKGTVGDVEVKKCLSLALNNFLDPIRAKRALFMQEKGLAEKIIYEGTLKMQKIAETTLDEMSSLMGLKGTWKKICKIANKS